MDVLQFLFQPGDMGLHPLLELLGREACAILSRLQHLDQLSPTGDEGRQDLRLFIRDRSDRGTNGFSEAGEDTRIEAIGHWLIVRSLAQSPASVVP